MKFDLIRPCAECPFRTDVPGYLRRGRAQEIADAITRRQGTFSCHKTNACEEERGECEVVETENSQHCAGALILLEHIEQPNQMMRVAERLGVYDRSRLDMDAPVHATPAAFIRHHSLGVSTRPKKDPATT